MPHKLGQVFLKNPRILSFIAKQCNGEKILEIGAGDGRLTKRLKGEVYAVELDKRFCERLKEITPNVICQDFLELEPFKVDCIVGNVPYYISSPILFRLLDWDFDKAILMFQKEFGEKMVAKPGDSNYGRLSLTSQYYFHVKPLKIVSKRDFSPVPKVDSIIMEIRKKREKDPLFDEIVRKIFSQKNKKLKNILKDVPEDLGELRPRHMGEEEIRRLLAYFSSKHK
ncbi:MAG: ribosomal RNA small subunit methyltransferase A [Candidatus Micrarchaeota archaeon]|nr:ribosomal RNA small subunit methyltransferase A [Candidatus Micrarchaeota archaeon]